MATLRIRVLEKIYLPTDCIQLTEGVSYQDTIIKGRKYNGESQISLSITNSCPKTFNIEASTVFSDNENQGNFEARIDRFTINGNQTVNIPLKYYGTFKGNSTSKEFDITINQSSSTLTLNITKITPPVIQNIDIELNNRENKTFNLSDFTKHYSDVNNSPLKSIILEGNLSQFRLNNNSVSSPIEISTNDIQNGKLSYIAMDTDDETETVVTIKAKNQADEISM